MHVDTYQKVPSHLFIIIACSCIFPFSSGKFHLDNIAICKSLVKMPYVTRLCVIKMLMFQSKSLSWGCRKDISVRNNVKENFQFLLSNCANANWTNLAMIWGSRIDFKILYQSTVDDDDDMNANWCKIPFEFYAVSCEFVINNSFNYAIFIKYNCAVFLH